MTAIAKRAAAAPAQMSETEALFHVIERAATNPNIDIEKMERLIQMQERVIARNDEREFNNAFTAAQSEMSPIAADCRNPQTRSKYASYAALDRVLRPIYTKHGFSLSFNTSPDAPDQYIRVTCDVMRGGHARHYQADVPADGKGAKGGDVMTKTHATGAAMSYGMRYLLKMIFNVAIGEDDDDGNSAGVREKSIDEKQAMKISDMIEASGANRAKFLEYLKVDAIENLPASRYDDAMAKLKAKAARNV